MAVTHYGSVNTNWGIGSMSVSFDVGSNDNRVLIVGMGNRSSWGQDVSSVSYGGSALAQLTSLADNSASDQSSLDVWFLFNPKSGTNTLTGETNGNYWRATAVAAYNCYELDISRATEAATGNGHGYTISIASSADDFMYSWWQGKDNSGWGHSTAGTEMYDSNGFSSVRQDTAGNPGTEQGSHSNNGSCHYGISLWPPQNLIVDVSGNPAIVATSAAIGAIDDGSITLSNIPRAEVSVSASIGGVLIKKPITADMVIYR